MLLVICRRALRPNASSQAWRLSSTAANNLRVFWGSQTGTAQGFAQEFTDEAVSRGFDCKNFDLKQFDPAQLKGFDGTSVFIVACYGMGEPTTNAKNFYTWLMDQKGNLCTGQRYAVFGLGSLATHKERFCVIGKNVDAKMQELGATRVWPRVDGDSSDCIEVQFDNWQREFLEQLEAEKEGANTKTFQDKGEEVPAASSAPTAASPEPAPSCPPPTKPAPSCPPPAPTKAVFRTSNIAFLRAPGVPVLNDPIDVYKTYLKSFCPPETVLLPVDANIELTPKATRSTKEMTLSRLPIMGFKGAADPVTYETGDHLIVYPENQPDVVERAMDTLDLAAVDGQRDTPFYITASNNAPSCVPPSVAVSVRRALASYADLHSVPTPKMLRALSEACTRPEDSKWLRDLAEGETYKKEVVGSPRTVLDVVRSCSSLQLPIGRFLEIVPRLRPRYYSIASSPLEYPDEVRIMYRVVQFRPKHDQNYVRKGICTNYMAPLQPPATLPCHIYKSTFRMPSDPRAPIIGIAGGTGIAPFRAFLGQRRAQMQRQPGAGWGPFELFYGVNDTAEFAYAQEVLQARDEGVITNLAVAIAKDAPAWASSGFVTDAVQARAGELWKMLQQNASIYVCGGAGGLGRAATRIFKENVIMKAGGLSEQDAEAYFSKLMADHRYLEDLSD